MLTADSTVSGTGAVRAVSGIVTGAGDGWPRRGARGILFRTTGLRAGAPTRLSGVEGGAWGTWATILGAGAAALERRYSHAPSSVTHSTAAAARTGIDRNHRRRAGVTGATAD